MSIWSPNSHILYREIYQKEAKQQQLWSSSIWVKPNGSGLGLDRSRNEWRTRAKRDLRSWAFWPELSKPSSVEMEPIQDSEHFDRILESAKELSQPLLVDWSLSLSLSPLIAHTHTRTIICVEYLIVLENIGRMATWCRKCIFLKPKLEKLAAEFDTK